MFILRSLYDLFTFIHDYALNELYDVKKIKQLIMDLQVQLELDEITVAEYDRQEAILVQRLKEAIAYHKDETRNN